MLLAVDVSVEELRMISIVDRRKQVGIHIVHRFAMQQIFGKPKWLFPTLSYSLLPVIERRTRIRTGLRLFAQTR